MNTDYKGYTIVAASEWDDASGLWNGRYRVLDDKGMVVYESFVKPGFVAEPNRKSILQ